MTKKTAKKRIVRKKVSAKAKKLIDQAVRALVKKHGARNRLDIVRGVGYCQMVWGSASYTEFVAFCLEHYVPEGAGRRQLLKKLDFFSHSVGGYFGMMIKATRRGADLADEQLTAADTLFSAFSASTHLSEDIRFFKIAAMAQLNFGSDDLKAPRNRAGWAARRLSSVGREVIPAEKLARASLASAEAERFVSSFNIHLDKIDFADKRISFPRNTRLISHWGLRDFMTGLNGSPGALPKQRAVRDIMRRIVDGEIPRQALDNPDVRWSPDSHTITCKGKKQKAEYTGALRWEKFRDVYLASRAIDPHTRYGNIIDNKFKGEREIPEEKVVGMLTEALSSPVAKRVARYVRQRLGRDLEPHDIYFKDFHGGAKKSKLRFNICSRYSDAEALTRAIPDVLQKLGFSKTKAAFLGSKIRVDNSRSAGHAWRPYTVEDTQLLRVRIDKGGINEQDFGVYMHELGHCVEGVLSSFGMDYHALWGVPNTAFSEAYAFTFQDRADQILGRKKTEKSDVTTLLRFWEVFEIAGPAICEVEFFHWLYRTPKATAVDMNRKVREIGDRIWKRYYADIFGSDGCGLMSVYSHMIWGIFYLADYPMGYIIAYQVRKYLAKKNLAREMERMCGLGDIYPEQWMKAAVGESVSVRPLLQDTELALKRLGL